MTDSSAAIDELRLLEPTSWPTYLAIHSGLPGPRANLALVEAVAIVADPTVVEVLLDDGGEYQVMCAAAAVGRRADTSEGEVRARVLATDERWRVREGVAIGLQALGDTAVPALMATVTKWIDDPHPLVQRAALAAICEPRLLKSRDAAAFALEACRRSTEHLVELTQTLRKQPDVRTLRQALGYCWSVAVAADPVGGLPVFRELDVADPDVAWIVNQNRRKKRLSTLL